MLKKLTILLFSIFLIAFNANAGSDGELALKKNKSEAQNTKDCFEKLNRATFAFNQGLDKALIEKYKDVGFGNPNKTGDEDGLEFGDSSIVVTKNGHLSGAGDFFGKVLYICS